MKLRGILLAVTAIVCGAGASPTASTEENDPKDGNGGMTRAQFISTQFYYLKGSAWWRQNNPSHKPGDGAPAAWLQVNKWGPGRDSVIVESLGLHDDGSCELLFVTIKRYDPAAGTADLHHFGKRGVYMTGAIKLVAEDTVQSTLSGILPNGPEVRIRDTRKLDDPAVFAVHAESWDHGAKTWQPLDARNWTRMTDETPCPNR